MNTQRVIFKNFYNEDDNSPYVAMLGGMAQGGYTLWEIAHAYKVAGDLLIESVFSNKFEAYELIYPILYNYRHSIELHLKMFVLRESGYIHKLDKLLKLFEKYMNIHHKISVPASFRKFILEIHDFDPHSTTFRYHGLVKSRRTGDEGEFVISLTNLREKMDNIEISFHNVMIADPAINGVSNGNT
jgi:hypothetical protein